MPFYEYQCESCGHAFETFVKTMDAPTPKCPECDGAKVRRKLSVFGVSVAQPVAAASRCGGCAQSGSCPMANG